MTAADTEKVRRALAAFDQAVAAREAFREQYYDDEVGEPSYGYEVGEPSCGYAKWDESMFDYALNIAEAGEHLADAIREVIA
jgi:hypothetical protein